MSKRDTWIISNFTAAQLKLEESFFEQNLSGYNFYSTKEQASNLNWFCEGYFLPRINCGLHCSESIKNAENLKNKYGDNFINYSKGTFTLINFSPIGFKIYSDRFGIKKFFYWIDGDKVIFTNDINIITRAIAPQISNESVAVYSLTYHFIGGITLFKNVYYNQPAQIFEFNGKGITISEYWNPVELIQEKETSSKKEIVSTLKLCFNQYKAFVDGNSISLSLTAGVDSRIMFSLLSDTNPHAYTYGQSNSIDCIIAHEIASTIGIEHKVYDFHATEQLFKEYAKKSVSTGLSLCSLHRAHRLWAIEQESEFANVMFIGTMGGEFVKGVNRDNYIVADFIYKFIENSRNDTIAKHLTAQGLNVSQVDIDLLNAFFRKQRWFQNPQHADLYVLSDISTHIHHSQNDTNFSNYLKTVITPYTDIDFLEVLFRSKYVYYRNRYPKNSFKGRLRNHEFSSDIQCALNYSLAKIPYNSGFKASEYAFSKPLSVVLARIRKRRYKVTSNFPLKEWMNTFVTNELTSMVQGNNSVTNLFEIEKMLHEIKTLETKNNEAFWLKYTTPIQIKYIKEYFG